MLKFSYFSIQVLTAALNNAQTSAEHAQQSATEAAAELASQQSMVGTAKQKVEQVDEQLHSARYVLDLSLLNHPNALYSLTIADILNDLNMQKSYFFRKKKPFIFFHFTNYRIDYEATQHAASSAAA